ncbi:MAG: hypothetical protein QNJ32_13250 [Xenococcaceae cyanobacterium MO_167.B27]|nr:hypothetical protein [Xenococcaceae cyanobacterium MO_167.B27]
MKALHEAGKLAIPAGSVLVAKFVVDGHPVMIAATATALAYLLAAVALISAAYVAAEYLKNRS